MDEELLFIIDSIKKRKSLIFNEEILTRENIKKYFYFLSEEVKQEGLECFSLTDYKILWGDFTARMKYTKDNTNYYMMISANSKNAPLQQIALGAEEGDCVYMMLESYPASGELGFVCFPKTSINKSVKGFIARCYRSKINFLTSPDTILDDKTKKCFEKGIESSAVFSQLILKLKGKKEENRQSEMKVSSGVITSIRTSGEFDTSCLTHPDKIQEMNKRIEENINRYENLIEQNNRKIHNMLIGDLEQNKEPVKRKKLRI